MAVPLLPEISHYITTNDSAGKSTYLDAPNPPPIYSRCLNYRVDYIYSALGSATGPVLTDRADYKEHQQVSTTPPHILFPVEGASAACVVTVRHCIVPLSLPNEIAGYKALLNHSPQFTISRLLFHHDLLCKYTVHDISTNPTPVRP